MGRVVTAHAGGRHAVALRRLGSSPRRVGACGEARVSHERASLPGMGRMAEIAAAPAGLWPLWGMCKG